jgi:hypothetical protein
LERFYLTGPSVRKNIIAKSVDLVREGTKVFKDLTFHLIGANKPYHIPVEQIEALIVAGGGAVV